MTTKSQPQVGWLILPVLAAAIIGNALMMGAGLAIAFKPFLGALKTTPKQPHEGGVMILLGATILGIIGLLSGPFIEVPGANLIQPATEVILHGALSSNGEHAVHALHFPTEFKDY